MNEWAPGACCGGAEVLSESKMGTPSRLSAMSRDRVPLPDDIDADLLIEAGK